VVEGSLPMVHWSSCAVLRFRYADSRVSSRASVAARAHVDHMEPVRYVVSLRSSSIPK
jgi:hypothetical protein